jgi:tRNA nucleotidyltransferase (CCA-adding enzyme)
MEHLPISTHLIHPQAIEVCRILNQNNYQAFIVGGCVRDLLLGQTPKDWDITTDASPQRIMEIFPKTIPTGLQHGTVTVCMGEGVENHFEVTTFRIEGAYSDGRRPDEVTFVMNVEQDLARRDLTINAIAYDPLTNVCVDPFHGIEDLKQGLIRAVGNPAIRFQEDGLRIMRVARFAARFGYQVEEETIKGMSENLETLKRVSKERIRDELCKTLMASNPNIGLRILSSTGALKIAAPSLRFHPEARDFPWAGELETRIAVLYLHRLQEVEAELESLKFSNREIKKVLLLQELFGRWWRASHWGDSEAYKVFISIIKNRSIDDYPSTLNQFIRLGESLGYPVQEWLNLYQNEVVFARKEMLINGNDLMEAGMRAGPKLKIALDKCYNEILLHPEHNTKAYLLEVAKRA